MTALPSTTRAVVLAPGSSSPDSLHYDARIEQRPLAPLKEDEVLVRVAAAAFNHRELWIRKNLYPGIVLGSVLGADGAGVVIASGRGATDPLLRKRVFLVPMRGWEAAPDGPESRFGILGGGNNPPLGTFADYVVVERDQVIETPAHLDDEHAAAWPLAGITAWRAATVHGQVGQGQNVLITGIGGGVALTVLQLCIALGANVYVTSGDNHKIQKAVELGAKGGVIYKSEKWPAELAAVLKKHSPQRPILDVVIDSAGGEILSQVGKLLKAGAKVVVYGMTAEPTISFTMREVLRNIELKGSTMGSRKELKDATEFIARHKVIPVVSNVLDDLQNVEEGFRILQEGSQVGKIVIKLGIRGPEEKGRL